MGKRARFGVGLIGLGTVGTEVFHALQDEAFISARSGVPIRVVKVAVAQPDKARRVAVPADVLTANGLDVVDSPAVDIVVEVMGGIEPARTYVLHAIEAGKAVVTANKQLVATCGPELFARAEAAAVELRFEASVGGGIPLIKPISESLAGTRLRAVTGILNGTTNYILTQMAHHRRTFNDALATAQQQGFAEADPRDDIEGHDAAAKLAILAMVAFRSQVVAADVYREGITRITPRDFEHARELGFSIKLLAIARDRDGEIELRVHPALIPEQHPLALVPDEFNAVMVEGEGLGSVVFSGRGAGGEPTAAAVVGDIIDLVMRTSRGTRGRTGVSRLTARRVRPIEEVVLPFYVSMQVTDRPGVFAKVASVFGEEQVSIASIVQKSRGAVADVVLVTHDAPERAVRRVLDRLGELDVVKSINNVIRVEATV